MINFNKEKSNLSYLGEMQIGETFIYQGDPFIKVRLENNDETTINLLTGEEVLFSTGEKLKIIEFNLTIKEGKENDR